MNFTLKQLEYFRALATLGNFGRAAEASNISQPALSVQIRTLEESLGGRLIERQSRASVLTPLGREVLPRADPLYDIVLLTDWNWPLAETGRGSAIFLHQWRRPGYSTEGCLAFARPDIRWLAERAAPGTPILI